MSDDVVRVDAEVIDPDGPGHEPWQQGKAAQYFEVRLQPDNDALTIQQKAGLAGISNSYAQKLEYTPGFREAVRRERLMRASSDLSVVDATLLSIVKDRKNEVASVSASRELFKRWDPEYKERSEKKHSVSFVDIARRIYGVQNGSGIDPGADKG